MKECIIVGGGIAGLQAAIQLGRSGHEVLVIDAGYGRSTLCRNYHNVLGWPEGVSGDEIRRLGREHAGKYGVEFTQDYVEKAKKIEYGFELTGKTGQTYTGSVILLATGVLDNFPEFPGIKECLGLSIYVCPDCDAYEIRGKKTVVLGAGNTGAQMALILSDTAGELVYINHENRPVKPELLDAMADKGIAYHPGPIQQLRVEGDGQLTGVILAGGEMIPCERGFIAFGGNEVKSHLASQLGIERHENQHILTDPRTKETNIAGVWAAGDVGLHSEQLTIAMGEGMQAAIWMHKALLKLKNNPALAGAT